MGRLVKYVEQPQECTYAAWIHGAGNYWIGRAYLDDGTAAVVIWHQPEGIDEYEPLVIPAQFAHYVAAAAVEAASTLPPEAP